MRPVLVMSNNKINNSEKIVVVCITDAKGKTNANNLPVQDSWFLQKRLQFVIDFSIFLYLLHMYEPR